MNRILLSMAVVLPVMMLVASPASAIREAGFQAVQQQQPVTGTVVDETGEPVIGAPFSSKVVMLLKEPLPILTVISNSM